MPTQKISVATHYSAGLWRFARLLADASEGAPQDFRLTDHPQKLTNLYDQALRNAGAADSQGWRTELRPLLGVLAAAGSDKQA